MSYVTNERVEGILCEPHSNHMGHEGDDKITWMNQVGIVFNYLLEKYLRVTSTPQRPAMQRNAGEDDRTLTD